MRPIRLPVVAAAVALDLSRVPTLLPRPMWLQGVVSGLVTAQVYALGAVVRAMARPMTAAASRRVAWRPSQRPRRRAAYGVAGALVLLLVAAVLAGHAVHARMAAGMGLARPPLAHRVGAAALGLLLGVGLVGAVLAAVADVRKARRTGRAVPWVMAPVLALAGCITAGPWAATGAHRLRTRPRASG